MLVVSMLIMIGALLPQSRVTDVVWQGQPTEVAYQACQS